MVSLSLFGIGPEPECRRAELFYDGKGMFSDCLGRDSPKTIPLRDGFYRSNGSPRPSMGNEFV
jgi:hypothetical protein